MSVNDKGRGDKNMPCFDGKALTILLVLISMVIAVVWFGHARLQTNNSPSVQKFAPKAPDNR